VRTSSPILAEVRLPIQPELDSNCIVQPLVLSGSLHRIRFRCNHGAQSYSGGQAYGAKLSPRTCIVFSSVSALVRAEGQVRRSQGRG